LATGSPTQVSRRRVIWGLNITAFSWSLGLGAAVPVIPLLSNELQPGLALAGLVVAMGGLGRLAVSYITGGMLDRFGRRRVGIVGVTIRMIFSFLEGLSPTYFALVVFRFGSGVGTAIWGTGLATITADISTSSDRGSISGRRQGYAQLGAVLGPFIGAAAWGITGDIRVPFFINGFSKLVCLLVFIFIMMETRTLSDAPGEPAARRRAPAPPQDASQRSGAVRWGSAFVVGLASSGMFLVLFGMFTVGMFRAAVPDTVLPVYLRNVLELPQSQLGLVISAMGVGGLVASFVGGRVSDRWNVAAAILPGAALCSGGLVLLTLGAGGIAIVGLGVALGAGVALIHVGTQAFAVDVSPPGARGKFFGKTQASMNLATLVGPLFVGAVADALGYDAAFLMLAVFFLAMMPIALLMWRWGRQLREAQAAGRT
jgi:MFS family permease